MKTINAFFGSILFLFGCVSCISRENSEQEKTSLPITIHLNLSEVNSDTMNLSEIAERIEYIPLQTTDSSLMGDIYNFVVTSNCFFIKDGLQILRFNNNGDFDNSLYNVGHGPGESNPVCFAVDEENGIVYVFTKSNIINEYSYDGDYLKSINKPINPPENLPPWSIGYFNRSLFISVPQLPRVKFVYSFFDLDSDSVRILYNNYRKYDKSQENIWPSFIPYDYHYQITNSCVLFKEQFCDTVFSVDRNFIREPRYVIDLGRSKLEWEAWRDQSMFHLMELGFPFGYIVQSFVETKSFLLLNLTSFKEPQLFTIYKKESQTSRIFSSNDSKNPTQQVFFKNDLDRFTAFPPANKNGYINYYNNCLYSIINATDFAEAYSSLSEEEKNSSDYLKSMYPVFSKIDENNNPIIMKVYLK